MAIIERNFEVGVEEKWNFVSTFLKERVGETILSGKSMK